MLKQELETDLKAALLAGDRDKATTLRGLKSAILYAEVASSKKDIGFDDEEITSVLRKEAKKRQESADLFSSGGNREKADQELAERALIEKYLPKQLSEDKIRQIVQTVLNETTDASIKDMGRIINQVKEHTKNSADGGLLASIVKEELGKV
jgi:uncharacterized protein YqeY